MKDKVFDLVLFWGLYYNLLVVLFALFLYAQNPVEGVFMISLLLFFTFFGFLLSDDIINDDDEFIF